MSQDKDEIVKMAREAGLWVTGFPTEHIDRFAALCRAPLVAENAALKPLADVGAAMVGITTTVRGQEEWDVIPELWMMCMRERDALIKERDDWKSRQTNPIQTQGDREMKTEVSDVYASNESYRIELERVRGLIKQHLTHHEHGCVYLDEAMGGAQ